MMAQPSMRDPLESVDVAAADTNASLWFDRFLYSQSRADDKKDYRRDLVSETADLVLPQSYARFFLRWYDALKGHDAPPEQNELRRTRLTFARVDGRLAVGLGAEAAIETSIALHRVYGTPFIPGSALKGLTAAFVRKRLSEKEWGVNSAAYRTLFGTTVEAGYVTFFDAQFVPGTGRGRDGRALMPDVMTVHHPNYYQGDSPPADWDSPNPVPFLSATGVFLLALSGPPAWRDFAHDLLCDALREYGVGAKTSSGYGRMTAVTDAESQQMLAKLDQLRETPAKLIKAAPLLVLPRAEDVQPRPLPALPRAEDVPMQIIDLSQLPHAEKANKDEVYQPPIDLPPTSTLPPPAPKVVPLDLPPTSTLPPPAPKVVLPHQVIYEGVVIGVNNQQGTASVLVGGKALNPRPQIAPDLLGKLGGNMRVRVRDVDGKLEIFEILS